MANYEAAVQLSDRSQSSLQLAQSALERARREAAARLGGAADEETSKRLRGLEDDFEKAHAQAMEARKLLDRATQILDIHTQRAYFTRRDLHKLDEMYKNFVEGKGLNDRPSLDRQSGFLLSLLDEPTRERLHLALDRSSHSMDRWWSGRVFPESASPLSGFERDRLALALDRKEVSTDFWLSVLRLLAEDRPEILVEAAGQLIAARDRGIEIDPAVYRALGTLLHYVAERAEAAGNARNSASEGDSYDDRNR